MKTQLLLVGALLLVSTSGCKSAANLLYEPKPEDRLDGYDGSLAQAGINTTMDWGPRQNGLLAEFTTLKEKEAELLRELERERAEKFNLQTRLNQETEAAQREKAQRVQAEAQADLRNQQLRERDALILSLRIEKAKLEQQNLLGKIDALNQALQQGPVNPVEAAATPPGRR
jgi:hypothetical protein